MGKAFDLEGLRSILSDQRETHIAVAKVLQMELESTRSTLFAKCKILTQDRDVVAKVAWSACSNGGGLFQFPQVNDLVLLVFAEKDAEQCFLVSRLSSYEDSIPADASNGNMVLKAFDGKKLFLQSNTKVNIGKSAGDLTEPLVLGEVLKEFLEELLKAFLEAPQIGITPFGPAFLDPGIRTKLTQFKTEYITDADSNILSQIAFTERGD